MNNREIRELKGLITYGNLYDLKERFREYQKAKEENGYQNDVNIFQQLFIHACSSRQFEVAKWLYNNLYEKLDTMGQSAVRHTFNYCNATMDARKHPKFKNWLNGIVLANRKKFAAK